MPAVLPHASRFQWGEPGTSTSAKTPTPFAGCIGANQEFSLLRQQYTDPELLSKYPDVAPWIPLRDSLSPKQFFKIGLWKAAAVISTSNGAIYHQTQEWTKSDIFVIGDLLAGILDYPFSCEAGGKHEVSLQPFFCIAVLTEWLDRNLATGLVVPGLIGSLIVVFILPLFIWFCFWGSSKPNHHYSFILWLLDNIAQMHSVHCARSWLPLSVCIGHLQCRCPGCSCCRSCGWCLWVLTYSVRELAM